MDNSIVQEWNVYKKEIEDSLKEAIESDEISDKETMSIMLEMLKIAKLKERLQYDDERY